MPMRLTASDIVTLHRPTICPLRVYLRQQGVAEAEPSEFKNSVRQTLRGYKPRLRQWRKRG